MGTGWPGHLLPKRGFRGRAGETAPYVEEPGRRGSDPRATSLTATSGHPRGPPRRRPVFKERVGTPASKAASRSSTSMGCMS